MVCKNQAAGALQDSFKQHAATKLTNNKSQARRKHCWSCHMNVFLIFNINNSSLPFLIMDKSDETIKLLIICLLQIAQITGHHVFNIQF